MPQVSNRSTLTPRWQPFLFLTASLAGGILIDRWIEPRALIVVCLALISGLASVALALWRRNGTSVLLLIAVCATGALLSLKERTGTTAGTLGSLYESKVIDPDNPVELTGVLKAPPEPAPGAYYLNLAAEHLRVMNQDDMPVSGRAWLMISVAGGEGQLEFTRLALDYGSRIRVLVRLERARAFANPGSPDFNEFLERRGYDLKGVIKSPLLIEPMGAGPTNRALAVLYHLRMRLIDAIDSSFNATVSGTLKAMLTDNRYYLDRQTVERLREGSTFHTLSISGLHIGIIAWALLGGASALKRRKKWRIGVCLFALWAYATMVGLAPPVTRATTMITAGLIAPLLFRRAASINTVALAAFLMLAEKPALVADPGFQLSFIAVAGIVAIALPLADRLRQIGQWRPTSHTPHPPSCSRIILYLAETLFWDERAFNEEMRRSPVRYRLKKARAARVVGRLYIQPLLRAVVLLIITSLAIQLTTLPLMAAYFNLVAPVGVLLNIAAGFLTGVLMLTGISVIVITGVSVWLAAQLGWIVNATHYLLVNSIGPFVDVPFATFRVAHYEGTGTVIYVLYFVPLALIAVLVDRWQPLDRIRTVDRTQRGRSKRHILRQVESRRSFFAPVICGLILTAAVLAVLSPPSARPDGKLRVYFLDVGQGDSAFVVFPRGKTMLVDGGGELTFGAPSLARTRKTEPILVENSFSVGERVVCRFIWSLGRTRVDYLLTTHAHADHIGGLSDVVQAFRVGQGITGRVPDDNPEYDRFAQSLRKHQTPLSVVRAGEQFEIDGVRVEVLWPPPASGMQVTSGNNDSVVLRLVYGSASILLAGDIEAATEAALVSSGVALRSDLLKVPHHGSKTSSTEPFLAAVNPVYAVVSVGERSRFGHPHGTVVERYRARKVTLLQTGMDGTVTIETDGLSLGIRTYRKRARKHEGGY